MAESSSRVNGPSEGPGSRQQGLYNTYLGRWMTLFRVQSIPISSVIVSIGYLVAVEEVLMGEVLALITVAAVAHAGINAQNDALDYYTDLDSKDDDKPLMSGAITVKQAIFASSILIAISIGVGTGIFGESGVFLLLAVVLASLYNIVSSTRWWSGLVFGAWGFVFTLFGYSVGNGFIAPEGIPVSISIGLMTASFIFLGNVIDADADEETVHSKLGGRFEEYENGMGFHIPGEGMDERYVIIGYTLWTVFLIAESVSKTGLDEGAPLITALMAFATYKAVKLSCYVTPLDKSMKRDFLEYVILTATAILVVYSADIGVVNMGIMFAGSLVWALSLMKILYGRFLYFP